VLFSEYVGASARNGPLWNKPRGNAVSRRETILAQIHKVAEEQNKVLAPLTDDLPLLESGLDSLCFAILVTRLEDIIAIDPFDAANNVKFPETVGELIALYN
jgi:hypothetical protein